MEILTVLMALLLGVLGGYGLFSFFHRRRRNERQLIRNESVVLLERIEKVFKVVLAEGHFSEIYDHQSHKEYFYVFKVSYSPVCIRNSPRPRPLTGRNGYGDEGDGWF